MKDDENEITKIPKNIDSLGSHAWLGGLPTGGTGWTITNADTAHLCAADCYPHIRAYLYPCVYPHKYKYPWADTYSGCDGVSG